MCRRNGGPGRSPGKFLEVVVGKMGGRLSQGAQSWCIWAPEVVRALMGQFGGTISANIFWPPTHSGLRWGKKVPMCQLHCQLFS